MAAVQHLVLVKFKPAVDQRQIADMFRQIGELRRVIPGITYYAWGANTSAEGLNQGLTHGFVMTFESPAARDAYLWHPEHVRVKDAILPHVAQVVVLDFEVP